MGGNDGPTDVPVIIPPEQYLPCVTHSDCPDGRQCINYGGFGWDSVMGGMRWYNNWLCEL